MKQLTQIACAVAAIACGFSVSAQAQTTDYNPSWYISPSINASQPDTQVSSDKNTSGIGLRFGKAVSPTWDVQMGLAATQTSDGGPAFRQTTLGFDGLYMMSRKTFRPFLLMGIGAQYDELKLPGGSTSQTSPYLSAGLGFQATISDQWGMQLDYRRNHAFPDGNKLGVNMDNNSYVTFSLHYLFDKPAPERYVAPPTPYVAPVVMAPAAPYVAPAPMPAPVPAPRYERYTLSATELFGFDSAQLGQPQAKLDEIAAALNLNSQVTNVNVIGYTDRLGSTKYNQALSERRAVAVRDYLISKGLSASRLNAEGKGEANPAVMCDMKNRTKLIECLEPNRRVEIEQITVQRRVQ